MYWEFLLASTWIFWLLPVLAFGLVVWALEEESLRWATLTVVGFITILIFLTDVPVLSWIGHHYDKLLLYAALYIAIGAVWGIVKWYFYVLNRADDFEEHKTYLLKNYTNNYKDDSRYPTFKDWLLENQDIPPQPHHNKSRITSWMIYWPASAVWTLLNDPLKRIYRFIYEHISSLLTRISNHIFSRFGELQ